jgi:alpha-L-fucosidase
MAALKDGGFKSVILTAKHHDGFCLWPSNYTDHDVASSAWRDGHGDVVREVADAAYEAGLQFGFYLSPADLHELKAPDGRYGNGSKAKSTEIPTSVEGEKHNPGRNFTYTLDDYNRYFMNQLHELLTEYGPVNEVWFDGANPAPGTGQTYDYLAWIDIIRELMPEAVIAIGGPDVRWVGNETGIARESEWSPLPFNGDQPALRSHSSGFSPTSEDLGSREQLAQDPEYLAWYPAEADTSIRPGWFYHADEDDQVMSVVELIDIYYKSVGRNANLLLNVPPDQRGLLHAADVKRLAAFGERLRKTFDTNHAERGHGRGARPPPHAGSPSEREHDVTVEASSAAPGHAAVDAIDGVTDTYWMANASETTATLTFDLGDPQEFNRVSLQESMGVGQRIESFALDIWDGSSWKEIANATTVGYKRLLRFDEIQAQKVRLRIEQSRANPTLASFGLYFVDAPPDFVLNTSDIAISRESMNTLRLSATIHNRGFGPSSETAVHLLDTTGDDQTQLASRTVPPLLTEGSIDIEFEWDTDGLSTGVYVVQSVVDPADQVDEISEENNTATTGIGLPLIELDGKWRFHRGDDMNWKDSDLNDTDWVVVNLPSSWEEHSSYTKDPAYGWYRKTITIPKEWKGNDLLLPLGKIDDVNETFFNGSKIGQNGLFPENESGFQTAWTQMRKYTVPAAEVNFGGENVIAIRVYDGSGGGGLYSGPLGPVLIDV